MLRSTLKTLGLLASLSLLGACGGGDNGGSDCEDTAAQMRGAMIVMGSCTSCHSESATDRQSAPDDINFDDPADIDMFEGGIRTRAIDQKTMPPGGPLSAEQISDLQTYLDCR